MNKRTIYNIKFDKQQNKWVVTFGQGIDGKYTLHNARKEAKSRNAEIANNPLWKLFEPENCYGKEEWWQPSGYFC